jgi:hypothetical protein
VARSGFVRVMLTVIGALLLCASRGRGDALRVPLAIEEPVGVARDAEPVTTGVPLPAGRVRDPNTLWIADPAGRHVPTQTRVLESWPDGSVRWVLVDFLATVGAHEAATYTLRDGKAPPVASKVAVRLAPTAVGYELSSGPIGLAVTRTPAGFFRKVRIGDADLPMELAPPALEADGLKRDDPDVRDWRIAVETEGPVRTELLFTGRDPGDIALEGRVAAFAGTPWVRLQLTITSLSDRSYTRIRSLVLTLESGSAFRRGALGLDGHAKPFDLDAPHGLAQLDARRVRLDGAAADGVGDGWARAVGDDVAVTAVRRYFPEEWPQLLTVGRSGLGIDLLHGADDPVDLGIGAAKTFELWLAFEDPAHASDPARLATALQHPLIPRADPTWTVATRALPNAIAPDSPGAKGFLAKLDVSLLRYLARNRAERWDDGAPVPCDERKTEHERVGAFGAFNWGDWNFPGYRDRSEGCDAWGNLEYDLTQVLGLDWTAGGSRYDWDAFVAAARHYRDVDILHHAPGHEDLVGINHPHKAKHFAVESPNTVDLGHTWLEGLLTHYRLTGEVRSLEAARGIADVLVRRMHKAGNPRQYGWPMIALAAAYDATRDGRYRDAASGYADAAVAIHEPTPAFGDWKMGILADGLASVYTITDAARLRDWLVRYANAFAADPARFPDARYALPLGYLARLTGTARYRELGLETVAHLTIGDWGKTLAVSGRTGFRILGPLALGVTPARAPPPRRSPPEPRSPSPSRRAPAPPAGH